MTDAAPSVRALAGRHGLTVETVAERTGRTTVAREDVERVAAGGSATGRAGGADRGGTEASRGAGDAAARYWQVDHAAFGPVAEEPLSGIARAAAQNLGAANAMIPQVTHHDRAETTMVDALRKRWRAEADAAGVKLTALAFHVAALTRCLIEFPRFNASLAADGTTLTLKRYVHVGIAVDTPHGLMVPVIRDADRKGLFEIAGEIAALAARAQERKLKAGEMGGASMTISNLGGIGGTAFTPIVNPPEVAILGLTRTEVRPVWREETWAPVPFVPLDLSYDHRVLNGADAARFCRRYAELFGDPRRLLPSA